MSDDVASRRAPQLRFSTADYGGSRRGVQVMRDATSEMCDLTMPNGAEDFRAETVITPVGSALLADARSDALTYERRPIHLARGDVDHFQLQYILAGGSRIETGRRVVEVAPGDVVIFDTAQASQARMGATGAGPDGGRLSDVTGQVHHVSLLVPRLFLAPLLAAPEDAHAALISGRTPFGRLIGDQMLSLLRQAPYLTPGEGEAATQALTTLVAGALGRRAESEQTVGGAMREAMLTSVKRHIEQHLGSPDLTAEALCRSFGLSRATLYRLFEPLGGLKTYIQQRRLQAAFAMLVSPAHRHRRIIEIAADCNFSSDATFIRAFRRSFGLTPGEVRSAVDAMRWHEAADGNGGEIGAIGMAWIRQLTNLRPEALNQ